MKYEEPNMQVFIWEEEMLPITQVSEGEPFGDLDAGGLPVE